MVLPRIQILPFQIIFLLILKNKSAEKYQVLEMAIQRLIERGTKEVVSKDQWIQGVYLFFFIVLKKNLKWLKHSIKMSKFKMETIRSILGAIQKGGFLNQSI